MEKCSYYTNFIISWHTFYILDFNHITLSYGHILSFVKANNNNYSEFGYLTISREYRSIQKPEILSFTVIITDSMTLYNIVYNYLVKHLFVYQKYPSKIYLFI